MHKDDLFNAAPRLAGEVTINGHTVEVKALSLSARLNMGEGEMPQKMAWVCTQGCDALADSTADEVLDRLDAEAITIIANKIIALSGMGSEEEEAEKKSESSPS